MLVLLAIGLLFTRPWNRSDPPVDISPSPEASTPVRATAIDAQGSPTPGSPNPATSVPPITSPEPPKDADSLAEEGLAAFERGEYDLAVALLSQTLEAASGDEAEWLRVILGRAHYCLYDYRTAAQILSSVDRSRLTEYQAVLALGYLAAAHLATGEWQPAIEAYETLLTLDDSAADVVRWEMAKAYDALEQPALAAEQLAAIDLTPLPTSRQAEVLEEMGRLLAEVGNWDGAIAAYEHILQFAENASYRALILHKQGLALLEVGSVEEATSLFRQVVEDYTYTGVAHLALTSLEGLGGADVDDLTRAVVLYHASLYEQSLEAIGQYREDSQMELEPSAAYYAGLALQALGRHDEALTEFELAIEQGAGSTWADEAWMAKAESLQAKGLDPSSFYEQFFRSHPDNSKAPSALWKAAVYLEREGRWDEASYYYRLLHTNYPNDSASPEALFREGLMSYADGDSAEALQAWQGALSGASSGEQRARVLFWVGLANQRYGDQDAAQSYLAQAVEAAPNGYYGLRANDLLQGIDIFHPTVGMVSTDAGLVTKPEEEEIWSWVRSWSGDEAQPLPELADQAAVRRCLLLWDLGRHAESTEGLTAYRGTIKDNPQAVLSLGTLCQERGIFPLSIWSAERLLTLGQAAAAGDPPPALLKMAYPTPYADLINAFGQEYGVDPFLFLALVRQESRFDPEAQSWVGALGLTQVMPATGAEIAAAIGPADYRHDMLRRPALSIRFGMWYLGHLLDLCEGDWIAAIASYNGGYGNVLRWSGGLPISDHDLFTELVSYSETRTYIRLVYSNYQIYRSLYSTG